jgi:hypothetical protein
MLKFNFNEVTIQFRNDKLHSAYNPEKYEVANYTVIKFGIILESNWQIILEKLLHNYSNINNIEIVKEFQNNIDGDYSIFIFNTEKKDFFGFTDILGRLPIYYLEKETQKEIIFSVNPPYNELQNADLNIKSTIDFLVFGFQTEDSTIFDSIKKLSCFHFLNLNENKIIKNDLNWPNWWIKPSYSPKKNLNKAIKAHSLKLKKLLVNEEEVIVDLSGGFDSRLVHALYRKERNLLFLTQKYVQNEFKIASKLTNKERHKFLNTEHKLEEGEIEKTIKQTDGLVNPYTSYICFKEQKEYSRISKANYRIMGFGGEFLRKPYKKSILFKDTMIKRFDFNPKKLNLKDSILKTYIISRSKKLSSIELKRFYYSYYLNLVVHAGEHRSRMDHITIQPLFSKEIIAFYLSNNSSSFRLFFHLLQTFEANLEVPIFKYGYFDYWKAIKLDFLKFIQDEYLFIRKKIIPIKISRLLNKKKYNSTISNLKPHDLLKPILNECEFDKDFYGNNFTDRFLGLNILLHELDEWIRKK